MSSSDWMGRYRPLVSALVQHSNLFSNIGKKLEVAPGMMLASQEWQTLEYLIEHENEDMHMAAISRGLGIAQSSLNKYMNTLCKMKLAQRLRLKGNRKSVIPKPTDLGREIYHSTVESKVSHQFAPFFADLAPLTDESILCLAQALERFNLQGRVYDENNSEENHE